MTEAWSFAFACGVAAAAACLAYLLFERLARLRDPLREGLRRLRRVDGRAASSRSREEGYEAVAAGAAAGALFGLLLGLGVSQTFAVLLLGAAVGAGGGWFVRRGAQDTQKLKKLRQVAALYEAVDFYTRAGYTIRQSLSLAVPLAPDLRGAVERCLAAWPAGPVRALDRLAQEIGLPEAALLASVLAHAEESGIGAGRTAIEEESRSLEALRQTLAELKIVSKPMYFAIYRALPLAAVGGIMTGPLVYRLLKVMGMFFSGGF
ncbi:MAG: hypothetical protein ACPLRW_07410 [Moorellales bacterium]